jgi:hypothetical protein
VVCFFKGDAVNFSTWFSKVASVVITVCPVLNQEGAKLYQARIENRRTLYMYHHDGATLASEIYPGRIVLDDSYCLMIRSLIKQEVYS